MITITDDVEITTSYLKLFEVMKARAAFLTTQLLTAEGYRKEILEQGVKELNRRIAHMDKFINPSAN